MALRTIYKNASDEEIASLFCLGLLWPPDIEDIAMNWMLNNRGDENVAFLASKPHTYMSEILTALITAFKEIKIKVPEKQLALKNVIRFHLKSMLVTPDNYMTHLHELIELDREYSGKIELFSRPDCDEYFRDQNNKYPKSKSKKYAAQEFGIEKLYGLYYDDDFIETRKLPGLVYSKKNNQKFLDKCEAERKSKVLEETKRVLERFYSD